MNDMPIPESLKKHIGQIMVFHDSSGKKQATCTAVEYHEGLHEFVFIGKIYVHVGFVPFERVVTLTEEEIDFFV